MSTGAPAEPPKLVFAWDKPRSLLSWLPWFIFLSLAAHAATFFLFNVVYPVRATLPRPVPQITVLNESSPENIALLRWIEAEDPALIDADPDLHPRQMATAQYRPSYYLARTRPRTVAAEAAQPGYPEEQDPFYIIHSGQRTAPTPLPSPKLQPTALLFSSNLSRRSVRLAPPIAFSNAKLPLDSARFLLGVTDGGEVRYVFLQHSSGDSRLDADAARHLGTLAFEPGHDSITWGFATLAWGQDAYATPALPPASPEK